MFVKTMQASDSFAKKKKNAETLYVFGCPALGVTHITQQLAERKIGEI